MSNLDEILTGSKYRKLSLPSLNIQRINLCLKLHQHHVWDLLDGRIAGRRVVDRSAKVGKDLAVWLAVAVVAGTSTCQAVERVRGRIQLLGGQLRLED